MCNELWKENEFSVNSESYFSDDSDFDCGMVVEFFIFSHTDISYLTFCPI